MKKALVLALVCLLSFSSIVLAQPIKIGFLVKMPEEAWFQDEWKYAEMAGHDFGFEVIKIGATDGAEVLSAIDNLGAQGAQGFVICTPDVTLGPAILARADANGLKVMSVDDQFLGADDQPMEEVPHMGISAYEIGRLVGRTLFEEMNVRGWDISEVGAIRLSYEQLPTLKDRMDGATDQLVDLGFPVENITDAPMVKDDTEGGFNAANIAINRNPETKQWIAFGSSDSVTIGAVRALEGQGFTAENVVAVGINGDAFAMNEFEKDHITPFFASVRLDARQHGYDTARLMYEWITTDQAPRK